MTTDTPPEIVGPQLPAVMEPPAPPAEPPPPPLHVLREFPVSSQFCEVEKGTRKVVNFFMQVQPPEPTEKTYVVKVDPPFDSEQHPRKRVTQELRHKPGVGIHWEDKVGLDQLIENAVAMTYPDVDAIYEAAVGSRTVEYQKAETAAREYLAAEVKPVTASVFITSHALSNPTMQVQSETWAAQQIVEKADAFSWAVGQMRDVRAASQGRMRGAGTLAELEVAIEEWDGFILWLRTVLGLPAAGS